MCIRDSLISRVINDIDVISDGLLQGFSQLFTGVVTILGTLLFMLSVSVPIALVVVVVTPLSLGAVSYTHLDETTLNHYNKHCSQPWGISSVG